MGYLIAQKYNFPFSISEPKYFQGFFPMWSSVLVKQQKYSVRDTDYRDMVQTFFSQVFMGFPYLPEYQNSV